MYNPLRPFAQPKALVRLGLLAAVPATCALLMTSTAFAVRPPICAPGQVPTPSVPCRIEPHPPFPDPHGGLPFGHFPHYPSQPYFVPYPVGPLPIYPDPYIPVYSYAPVVSSVTPNSGPAGGGTLVTITGSDFATTSSVLFGGTPAAFSVQSDSQIVATAPARVLGAVDVQVVGGAGTSGSVAVDVFSYVPAPPATPASSTSPVPAVLSLSSLSGSTAGGMPITITGSGFAGTTAVIFGGAAAAFTIQNDSQLTVVVPPHGAGPATVQVVSYGNTSTITGADIYLYVAPVPVYTYPTYPTYPTTIYGPIYRFNDPFFPTRRHWPH